MGGVLTSCTYTHYHTHHMYTLPDVKVITKRYMVHKVILESKYSVCFERSQQEGGRREEAGRRREAGRRKAGRREAGRREAGRREAGRREAGRR